MTKTNRKKDHDITIESISYVNDPEAAQKRFEVYIEIVKKALIKEVSKNND